MRLNRHLTRGCVATFALALAALAACSGTDRSSGVNGDGFKPPVTQGGPCTAGDVRQCGIELGRNGNLVDCAKGQQTCLDDKTWSGCLADGTTFKSSAPLTSSAASPQLGTNAVGGSSTVCSDNPCNPYCQTFNDAPDSGITTDAETSVGPGPTISLAASNVPGGFQNKGTLDAQCSSTNPLLVREACQFDMHCGIKPDGSRGCIPFVTNEKNSCTGVDITAPPVCVSTGTTPYRNLTVCNRGSADLTTNIQCMGYPGNSPQYPEDAPGAGTIVLRTATTVDSVKGSTYPITAADPLKAGECRTYHVPQANFPSNGTMSVMCNPPSSAVTTTTTLYTVPSVAESTDFTNPARATSDTDALASATTAFTYTALDPVKYATGGININGFTNPADVVGAPNAVAARGALTQTTSGIGKATTATSVAGGGWNWIASTASTLKADVDSSDLLSAYADVNKATDPGPMLRLTGFTLPAPTPGAADTISSLELTVDATIPTGNSYGWVTIKKGATTLVYNALTTGNKTYSFPLASGLLTGADIASLTVDVEHYWPSNSGSGTARMTVNRVALGAKYVSPAFASMDATGYQWTAPPAGTYVGLEFTARAKSLSASGANLYLYAKRTDGTVVGNAVFPVTSTYPASPGTAIVVSAPSLTAADLTAGLKVYAQAYPASAAGYIDIDSIGLRPIYRAGSNERTIRFKSFGISVPPGATNVRLTTLASYKIDPFMTGDYVSGTALSISGSTTTLISTSSALAANNLFNTYQLGAQTITDFSSIEDPKLVVDVKVGKGSSSFLGTSTGSLDYLTMRLQYDSRVDASAAECNPSNNWTVTKANPDTICTPVTVTTYPPWTVGRVFEATCPIGSKPLWKYFGYTTATPTGTKVEFRFRGSARTSTGACPTLAPVTTSPPVPLATAEKTATADTQVCSLTSVPSSFCPVNLTTGLGATDSRQDCLQMDAYGIPVAGSSPAAPTLIDWRVTYDCIPQE